MVSTRLQKTYILEDASDVMVSMSQYLERRIVVVIFQKTERGAMPLTLESKLNLSGYPSWVRDLVQETHESAQAVVKHDIWTLCRDATIAREAHQDLVVGLWPLFERFPQFIALLLLKCRYGGDPAITATRGWLMKQLRSEQRSTDWYRDWADCVGVPRSQLFTGVRPGTATAVGDWCWSACECGSLTEGLAATGFAIKHMTGEWARIIVASEEYPRLFPEYERRKGMRWLHTQANYYPIEALDRLLSLLGKDPSATTIEGIRQAIQKTYELYALALETGMES